MLGGEAAENDTDDMGVVRVNTEMLVHVSKPGPGNTESIADEELNNIDSKRALRQQNETQEEEEEEQQQQQDAEEDGRPRSAPREEAAGVAEEREGRTEREEEPMPAPSVPLRRRDGMSDLWQQQGAFRSNRKSTKTMFEEFEAELRSAENEGKSKAEVEDIFSFTAVGLKHVMRDLPSEDRVAIHQAVVPTIDDGDKEELGIESIDTTPFAMFGVFDGHGGPACAEFLKESASTVLAHSPVLYDNDLTPTQRRAFATADSFEELERVHNDWAHNSGDLSGSTAILSTFQDGVLVMAGVGDSAGLYVDHMGKTHNLCPQHSTSNQREVERVLSMGGTIVNDRVAGCLMPTRTLGDLDCKRALGAIVSPHPELTLAPIYAPPDDGEVHDEPFLVIASDGLWDKVSFERVALITRKGLRSLRASEESKRLKEEKRAAKAARKAGYSTVGEAAAAAAAAASEASRRENGGVASGDQGMKQKKTLKRFVSSWRRTGSTGVGGGPGDSHFSGSAVLPRPDGLGPMDVSKNGRMDRSRRVNMDGSRKGSGVGFMDTSIRGLDASVKGGLGAAPIVSASLDSSQYPGLRAEEESRTAMDESLHQVVEGQPLGYPSTVTGVSTTGSGVDINEGLPYVKPVMTSSTEKTTGVYTAGSAAQNVAKLLVKAALQAGSHDDISVVVVTFKRAKDKSPPGSRDHAAGAPRVGASGPSPP